MKKDNITLKSYFETGDYPTEAQFIDLIDSFLNIEEEDAVISIIDNGDDTYTFQLLSGGTITIASGSIPDNIPIASIVGLQTALDSYVDLSTNQTVGGEKIWSNSHQFNGRIGIGNFPFGPNRLGDAVFQSPNIDTQALNWKNDKQETLAAIFMNPSGTVMTIKGFDDSVMVTDFTSIPGEEGVDPHESTIANTIEHTNGAIFINDQGVQSYPGAVTPVANAFFQVLQNRNGGARKPYWFGFYDGTTYDDIWTVDVNGRVTFYQNVIVENGKSIQLKGAGYLTTDSIRIYLRAFSGKSLNLGVEGGTDRDSIVIPTGTGITTFRKAYNTNDVSAIFEAPARGVDAVNPDEFVTKSQLDSSGGGTGLEALNEGNGVGWRLKGRDPNFHGDIGLGGIDFSLANGASSVRGAVGNYSFALGQRPRATGFGSIAFGGNNSSGREASASGEGSVAIGALSGIGSVSAMGDYAFAMGRADNTNTTVTSAIGDHSFAFGRDARADGNYSLAFGRAINALSLHEIVLGQRNTVVTGSGTTWVVTDRLFVIGNGDPSTAINSDAFVILKNGTITAPSLNNNLLETAGGKALITKEYADANYGVGSGVFLRKDQNETTTGNFSSTGTISADSLVAKSTFIDGVGNHKGILGLASSVDGSTAEIELFTSRVGGPLELGKGVLNIKTNSNTNGVNPNPLAIGGSKTHMLAGNGKGMLRFEDNWLRLNPFNDFSSGIFCGTNIFRTDGRIEIGQDGDKFLVTQTGAVIAESTITATNFIQSSDRRLKNKIKPISDETIDVEWKSFEMNGEKRFGVIAQDLERNHPEFVRTNKGGYKSVAYIDLLVAKNAELEARIKKLEKIIEKLI